MQIKKEDTMESVDVSADKVDLVKSLATNMAEQRIKLHVANAERQQWSVRRKRSASFDQLT